MNLKLILNNQKQFQGKDLPNNNFIRLGILLKTVHWINKENNNVTILKIQFFFNSL